MRKVVASIAATLLPYTTSRGRAALRAAGKTVEAVYYDNAGHNGICVDSRQFQDSARHVAAFVTARAAQPGTR